MSTGRKAAQAESTRAELIAIARKLFAEGGYAATPIEEIVRTAGMTRGALYHHFQDKRALFRAVFEELEREVVGSAAAAASPRANAWQNLRAGCAAFLDACLANDVQQIVLVDGPSVLGFEEWRAIEEQYGLAAVSAGLSAAMAGGFIKRQPVKPLAELLLAAINQAGLSIARDTSSRREVGAALERLLEGLRG
jgi:AcrR family transcriptional regulator